MNKNKTTTDDAADAMVLGDKKTSSNSKGFHYLYEIFILSAIIFTAPCKFLGRSSTGDINWTVLDLLSVLCAKTSNNTNNIPKQKNMR